MNKVKAILLCVGFLSFTASSSLIDITNNYHVFVAETFSGIYSDASGRVVAGGDVNVTGYDIGRGTNSVSDYSLISGGNVSLLGGEIRNGGIYAEGSVTNQNNNCTIYGDVVAESYDGSLDQIKDGTYFNNLEYTSPVDFDNVYQELQTISGNLQNFDATGNAELEYSTTLTLTGTNTEDAFTVLNVDGSYFNNATWINASNFADNEVIVVNVSGKEIAINSINPFSQSPEDVIFNFYEAEKLDIHSFFGTIIAPYAEVNGEYGQLLGGMYAKSFNGSVQFHLHNFNHNPPSENVPEPGSLIMLISGLLCLAKFAKLKRK